MTTWIYSHNEHSEGANALKEALRIRFAMRTISFFVVDQTKG